MSDWTEMRKSLEQKEKKDNGIDTIEGKMHYTLPAGAVIVETVFDEDGEIVGEQSYKLMQDIAVYIQDSSVDVRRGIFIPHRG